MALAVFVLDQLTKQAARAEMGDGRVVKLLGGLVSLDFTRNTGAAFGMFPAGGLVFTLVAMVVAAGIVVFYRRVAAQALVVRIALALILGGAAGNLADRIRFGYVVDFIDLRWWPVFNVADTCIVLGMLALAGYATLKGELDR